MALTVQLNQTLEKQFEVICERQRKTKSEVVSALVRDYVARHPQRSAYEVADELGIIGCVKGGPHDVAAGAKNYVRQAIRAKHYR